MAERNFVGPRNEHRNQLQPQPGTATMADRVVPEQQPAHHVSQPVTDSHSTMNDQAKPLPPFPHEENHAAATRTLSSRAVNPAAPAPVADTIDLGEYRHHPHDTNLSLPQTFSSTPAEDLATRFGITSAASISLHAQHAPLVTHTTIATPTHEIFQEQITREIHEHHVYHRVLPVITGQEIRPARHFVPQHDGSLVELLDSSALDGRMLRNVDRAVEEYASKPAHGDVSWADTVTATTSDGSKLARDVEDGQLGSWHGQMETTVNHAATSLPTREVVFYVVEDDVRPVEERLRG